jgi:hypothetical protein
MSATEGSGKIPTYMAMGLPIVTFDTPVSREYLGEAGIYAQFGSADDLAAKLRLALDERAWAARLGAGGRERAVRELSSDRAGPEIAAIYELVTKGDRAGRLPATRGRRDPGQCEARDEAAEHGVKRASARITK